MKLLIAGASGQVGACLLKVALRRNWRAVGTYRSFAAAAATPHCMKLDLCDKAATEQAIGALRPDWIVICASWTWVDGNEQDPARALRENVDSVENAVRAAAPFASKLCYLSSSYVFDGQKSSPYSEDDPVCPLNVYGQSKVAAESLIKTARHWLIARTIVVYGPDPQEKNFAYQIRRATPECPLKIPDDQSGNPTYGPDLANALAELIARDASGLWNIAGPETGIDRYRLGLQFGAHFGLNEKALLPVATSALRQAAARPLNGDLAIGKLAGAGIRMRTVDEVLSSRNSAGHDLWPE